MCPIPPSNCLDVAMAAVSVGKFVAAPSLGTAIDAALDVAGALPGVPSVGVIRRAVGAVSDITRRPSGFRKATLQRSWDEAADAPNGGKLCPDCGTEVSVAPGTGKRDWDNDHHNPKWKDRNLEGKTRKEVLDEYNKNTRLRCPSCNRADNQ